MRRAIIALDVYAMTSIALAVLLLAAVATPFVAPVLLWRWWRER